MRPDLLTRIYEQRVMVEGCYTSILQELGGGSESFTSTVSLSAADQWSPENGQGKARKVGVEMQLTTPATLIPGPLSMHS